MGHISIVIPVFNEESLISELVKRVASNTAQISSDFEIIIVDDGSADTTWKQIILEAESEQRVKGIKLSKNFGHHYAITAGLDYAKSEWVVVMDGDLQDRPEVIPELYEKAIEGYDVVFVSRKNRPESLTYKIMQKLFYFALNMFSGLKFDSSQANFSIINHKVVEAFKNFPEYSRFYGSTIKWLGFSRSQIYANHGRRLSGRPSYTIRKRIKLATDIIISFSERPIKIVLIVGTILAMIAFLSAVLVPIITRPLIETKYILGVILILAGAFFLLLVIMTTYIAEIFKQVKSRPLYVISDKINIANN